MLLPPAVPLETVAELSEGLVCLSGCARDGLALRDPARRRAARRRVRPGAVLRRAAASLRAGRRETPRGAPRPRRAPRRRDGRDGERPRPRAAADAAPGRARRDPLPHLARRVRARAAREPRGGAPRARPRWSSASPGSTVPRPSARRALAERLTFDLTEELGYRYPDFSDGADPAIRQLAAICDHAFGERYGASNTAVASEGARPPRRRAGADRASSASPASSSSTTRCSSSRGSARSRCAAATRRGMFLPPGRGRGQLGRLDRLLPDRALARRPGRERPLARALPQPGAHVGARHRPRLPARHPREADRRASPSATGTSTRRSSRASRRTARAARSATSARRSGCRTPSSSGSPA